MNILQLIYKQIVKHQAPRQKRYRSYNKIRSVLIIFESDFIERNKQIKEMISLLKADDKEVDAWGYVDKKQSTTSTIAPFRTISNKELSIIKRPHKDAIIEMTTKHYDLLIDLRLKPCLPMQYMTLYANADLKAGADIDNIENQGLCTLDLMIKLPEGNTENTEQQTQTLFEQIIHYIKIIND